MDTNRIHGLLLSVCCTVMISSGFQRTVRTSLTHAGMKFNDFNLDSIQLKDFDYSRPKPIKVSAIMGTVSSGPLAELAVRAAQNLKKPADAVSTALLASFGVARPAGDNPHVRAYGFRDDDGTERYFSVCVDCSDAAMLFSVRRNGIKTTYFTLPDENLKRAYYSINNGPNKDLNVGDEGVVSDFQQQAEYWQNNLYKQL